MRNSHGMLCQAHPYLADTVHERHWL